jgi:hypothetical protein
MTNVRHTRHYAESGMKGMRNIRNWEKGSFHAKYEKYAKDFFRCGACRGRIFFVRFSVYGIRRGGRA